MPTKLTLEVSVRFFRSNLNVTIADDELANMPNVFE